ncbi:MAG: tetratricopeptide repeat protein, partial [Anaerolineae bacterium]|nr:tetratricopeptide repeat protein [Anaerolineae bacterium]
MLGWAAEAARRRGDKRDEEAHLGNTGSVYTNFGQTERAIEYYEQSLVISREIGDKEGHRISLSKLGMAYLSLGKMERATEYYEQASA